MYVFYPASRLVGLTFDYREINQVCPFPPRNPSVESETEILVDRIQKKNRTDYSEKKIQTIEVSDNRDSKSDCFPRTSPSPYFQKKKSQSESPALAPKKPQKKKKLRKNSREAEKSPESIRLGENLKNLEIYVATKPTPLRRTWSRRFKKAVTVDAIKMAGLECALREMTHPVLNETLKSHNAVTFKLVKTGKY